MEAVAQRGCGITIPQGIQNTPGHGPEQPVLADAALSSRVGLDLRDAFQPQLLCDSVKLRYCSHVT